MAEGQNMKLRKRPVRVFAHYVLGRLMFLFFMCHPGTSATFADSKDYLKTRYPNRDLVDGAECELDQRRHMTPRSPADFAMRTGVPDSILNGGAERRTPDWVQSLERRFHDTIKSWLTGPRDRRSATDGPGAHPHLAFVTPPGLRLLEAQHTRANDLQAARWQALSEPHVVPRAAAALPVPPGSCKRSQVHMLLGFPGARRGASRGSLSKKTAANGGAGDALGAPAGAPYQGRGGSSAPPLDGGVGAAAVMYPMNPPTTMAAAAAAAKQQKAGPGLFSALMGGAADAYDSAVSYVGCVLVTSPVWKRYVNPPAPRGGFSTITTVSSAAQRAGAGGGGNPYYLVGISNIDPLEASRRANRKAMYM